MLAMASFMKVTRIPLLKTISKKLRRRYFLISDDLKVEIKQLVLIHLVFQLNVSNPSKLQFNSNLPDLRNIHNLIDWKYFRI